MRECTFLPGYRVPKTTAPQFLLYAMPLCNSGCFSSFSVLNKNTPFFYTCGWRRPFFSLQAPHANQRQNQSTSQLFGEEESIISSMHYIILFFDLIVNTNSKKTQKIYIYNHRLLKKRQSLSTISASFFSSWHIGSSY